LPGPADPNETATAPGSSAIRGRRARRLGTARAHRLHPPAPTHKRNRSKLVPRGHCGHGTWTLTPGLCHARPA
jgi:hypothetical protein